MSQNPDSMIIANLAQKLELDNNNTVLRNAEAYLRALKTKSNMKNSLGEIAKAVLCLDLAATAGNNSINREVAMKLSNLKRSAYLNSLHIIEKVLDLDKKLTIGEVCVQLSCTAIKDFSEQILKKYVEEDEIGRDFTHPQYIAAAIYSAARLKNVKIQKTQIITISRLKPAQWKELEQEFLKFAQTYFGVQNKKKTKDNNDDIEKYLQDTVKDAELKKREQNDEDEEDIVEDYDVWKQRILEEAYKMLEKKG